MCSFHGENVEEVHQEVHDRRVDRHLLVRQGLHDERTGWERGEEVLPKTGGQLAGATDGAEGTGL